MFSRKKLLLIALPLTLLGAAVAYFAITSNTEVVPVISWEPKVGGGPSFTLTPETTGVLWRKPVVDAQGKVTGQEAGFQDGRLGVYKLDANGKVTRFTCFSAEDRKAVIFDAQYGADGLIDRSRTTRVDGTLESEYRRGPDGSMVHERYDASGTRVDLSVTTLPDGSQRTARRGADGKVTVETVKADSSEKAIGERLGADGNVSPVFKLNMSGVRVNSWEYFDEGAILRHRGVFTNDGGMEITLFNDSGRPLLKQKWSRTGEDWNRSFYRVSELELYDEQGNVSAVAKLNADGMTPSEVSYFNSWDQRLNRKDVFDSSGRILRQEHYWGQEVPTHTQEIPPEQRQQVVLPARLIGEPAGANPAARVYRILGTPYADPLPAEPAALPPMFIAP